MTATDVRHATRSPEQTIALGRALAADVRDGDIVLLCGPMGAGKTYLAKGLVAALSGVEEDDVASPAYDIVHQFSGPLQVFHYDLFRMQHMSGDDLEWMLESLRERGVHVVEWGDRIQDQLKRPYTKITIAFADGDERLIEVAREVGGAQ